MQKKWLKKWFNQWKFILEYVEKVNLNSISRSKNGEISNWDVKNTFLYNSFYIFYIKFMLWYMISGLMFKLRTWSIYNLLYFIIMWKIIQENTENVSRLWIELMPLVNGPGHRLNPLSYAILRDFPYYKNGKSRRIAYEKCRRTQVNSHSQPNGDFIQYKNLARSFSFIQV
jgi:hypothetical protein